MSNRTKTQSKNFYDDEIHHVEIDEKGNKVIHLHSWVKRTYNPYLLDDQNPRHINDILIHIERVQEVYKKLYGGDDFGDKDEN